MKEACPIVLDGVTLHTSVALGMSEARCVDVEGTAAELLRRVVASGLLCLEVLFEILLVLLAPDEVFATAFSGLLLVNVKACESSLTGNVVICRSSFLCLEFVVVTCSLL